MFQLCTVILSLSQVISDRFSVVCRAFVKYVVHHPILQPVAL